jgi:hypothetical protein
VIPYADFTYFGVLLYAVVPTLILGLFGRGNWRWALFVTAAILVVQYHGLVEHSLWPNGTRVLDPTRVRCLAVADCALVRRGRRTRRLGFLLQRGGKRFATARGEIIAGCLVRQPIRFFGHVVCHISCPRFCILSA